MFCIRRASFWFLNFATLFRAHGTTYYSLFYGSCHKSQCCGQRERMGSIPGLDPDLAAALHRGVEALDAQQRVVDPILPHSVPRLMSIDKFLQIIYRVTVCLKLHRCRIFWYERFCVLCFEISTPSPLWSTNFKTKQAQSLSCQNILHRCTFRSKLQHNANESLTEPITPRLLV